MLFPSNMVRSSSSLLCLVANSSVVTMTGVSIASIRDNVSATAFSSPGTCLMLVVNCAIKSSCLACRGEAFSGRCRNA